MKKFIVILAAVVIAASVWATNQVTSINVAGYVKFNLDRGKNHLLRYDFFQMGTSDCTVINVIGSQLPQNSKVYVWTSRDGGSYNVEEYKRYFSGGWKTNWVPGTNVLDVGAGFWVTIPAAAALPTYALNLMGEVPNAQTSSVPIGLTYNLLGYSYPVQVAWTNTDLAKSAKIENRQGDKIYYWNGTTYDVAEYKRFFSSGWKTNWTGANITLGVGQGFWYYKTVAPVVNWVETRPYDLD